MKCLGIETLLQYLILILIIIFLNLTETQTFGIIAARAAASGVINTIPEQSFWKIEKIG